MADLAHIQSATRGICDELAQLQHMLAETSEQAGQLTSMATDLSTPTAQAAHAVVAEMSPAHAALQAATEALHTYLARLTPDHA